jgi:Resolvase, N terminal domain
VGGGGGGGDSGSGWELGVLLDAMVSPSRTCSNRGECCTGSEYQYRKKQQRERHLQDARLTPQHVPPKSNGLGCRVVHLQACALFDCNRFPRTQSEAKVQVNGKVSKITDSRGDLRAFGTSGGVMRALLLARKSNKVQISADKRGDGLSLETQDEVARLFAEAQGWTVIGAAGDTVSGRKVKPTARKNLGPWLTDPALVTRWDVLVAAKGDRISRERIEYWSELEAWAVAHGRTLVVVERGGVFFPPRHEGDSYNWTGIKSMAGAEWDVIRGRVVQSLCRIMRDGVQAPGTAGNARRSDASPRARGDASTTEAEAH